MENDEKKTVHPAWPDSSFDPLLSDLQKRYIPNLSSVNVVGLLKDDALKNAALVSSFGTESAVLIHFITSIRPRIPVLFLDTGKHFRETLDYRDRLADMLNLNLINVVPRADDLLREDPEGSLAIKDPNSCCMLRKTFPLQDALAEFDAWISGRKRFQGAGRSAIPIIERDGEKTKVNPLALWSKERLDAYFEEHDLPRHPLEAKGYRSIGCSPCTSAVGDGADPRSGRWSGFPDKTECGIHLGPDGTFTRSGKPTSPN